MGRSCREVDGKWRDEGFRVTAVAQSAKIFGMKIRGKHKRLLPNRYLAGPAPLASGEDLNTDELELAAAGLVRLPAEGLPDSFWKMPAPQVSFEDAVAAVTSERDED